MAQSSYTTSGRGTTSAKAESRKKGVIDAALDYWGGDRLAPGMVAVTLSDRIRARQGELHDWQSAGFCTPDQYIGVTITPGMAAANARSRPDARFIEGDIFDVLPDIASREIVGLANIDLCDSLIPGQRNSRNLARCLHALTSLGAAPLVTLNVYAGGRGQDYQVFTQVQTILDMFNLEWKLTPHPNSNTWNGQSYMYQNGSLFYETVCLTA